MNLDITKDSKIGNVVAEDYRAASVFKKHGIDFCCGGGRSIGDACGRKGVDPEVVLRELASVGKDDKAAASEYNRWDIAFLADYIVNKYHLYVREKIPELSVYSQKVAKVHGDWRPETKKIARLFEELQNELTSHMAKEEQVLFPYVKLLSRARKKGKKPHPPFGTVANPVHAMEMEHDFAGKTMRQIRELSDDYTPPEGACNTYRVLYALLKEFEENLHEHIHMENNILFPKAIQLEQSS
jgi:regulator of cell morphogenesis and NO signaling